MMIASPQLRRHAHDLGRQGEQDGRLVPRLRRREELRIDPRFRPAQVQQQQEGRKRRLGVLASEAQDRPARAGRIVVNPPDLILLPVA
jgi:hypothetical protein